MTVRPIVIAGDPVLHHPTEVVDLSGGVTKALQTLIKDMYDTLAASGGVGLSANQIGVRTQSWVVDSSSRWVVMSPSLPFPHEPSVSLPRG